MNAREDDEEAGFAAVPQIFSSRRARSSYGSVADPKRGGDGGGWWGVMASF